MCRLSDRSSAISRIAGQGCQSGPKGSTSYAKEVPYDAKDSQNGDYNHDHTASVFPASNAQARFKGTHHAWGENPGHPVTQP